MRLVPVLLGVSHEAAAAALLMPWRQMGSGVRWFRVGLLLLLVLTTAVLAWLTWRAMPIERGVVLAGAAGLLCLLVWGTQIGGLLEQNQPLAARLVPGHVRTLQRVALAAWSVLSLGLGTLAWLASWLADGRLGWPGCLLVAAALLAGLAWCRRWPLLWAMPLLPLEAGPRALWQAGVALWQAHLAVATLTLLGLLALSLAGLFGHGGPAHARAFARKSQWLELARSGGVGQAPQGSIAAWWGRLLERVPAWWLARLLQRATPSRRSVMARAEVVLHGRHHWLPQLVGMCVALLLVGLVGTAALVVSGRLENGVGAILNPAHISVAIGLTTAGLSAVLMLPKALWGSRREQALLALLPGMPQGRPLNRAVAVLQLRHAAVAWLLTLGAIAGVVCLADHAYGLCVPLAALPVGVLWLMRAPARLGPPAAWKEVSAFVATVAPGLALLVWAREQPADSFKLVAALAAACVVLSLLLGAWRWRQLVAAPAALPAGRLA